MAIMAGASSAADLEKDADVHRQGGHGEHDRQDQHTVSRVHDRLYPAFFMFGRAGRSAARAAPDRLATARAEPLAGDWYRKRKSFAFSFSHVS
jgi:hypothetical protein